MRPTHPLATEQGLRAAVEATANGVAIVDATRPDQPLTFVNAAFTKMTGYGQAETIGRNCRFLQGPETDPDTVAELAAAIADGRHFTCRLLNYRRDRSIFWNELTISPIFGDTPKPVGFVGIQNDVTTEVLIRAELAKQVQSLEQAKDALSVANTKLETIAYVDALTGLPTRQLFDDRLTLSLARAARTGDCLAVALIDLDGFKCVNDQLGHAAGDLALRHAAERMAQQIRATDTLARLGGDEFVLLFDTLVSPEVVGKICQRIAGAFTAPFDLDGAAASLGASIGTAFHAADGTDAKALLKAADAAMYQAKNRKRQAPAAKHAAGIRA